MNITYRKWTKADVPFVMSNWLRPYRNSVWAGCIPNHLYYDTMRVAVEQLVARGATIEVAEANDRLLGFCASEVTPDGLCCVLSLYVKDPYVRLGLDKTFIDRAAGTKPGLFVFRTPQVERALDRHWRYAPEVARRR